MQTDITRTEAEIEDFKNALEEWKNDSTQEVGEKRQKAVDSMVANFKSNTRVLHLTGLELTTLPPEIRQLHHLETLIISANQFTTLPDEVFSFSKLTTLYALNNQITEISDKIQDLTELTMLSINHNKLQIHYKRIILYRVY